MTPKERLLSTISFEKTDYTPLSFLQFEALKQQCHSDEEFVQRQLELELDPLVWLPMLFWGKDPGVKKESWKEPAQPHPILHTKFITPKGTLEAAVPQTEDWPYGDQVPLMSDFGLARQCRFAVREEQDLDALEWMLAAPSAEQTAEFRQTCKTLKALADKYNLATRAGFTRLADTVGWLCGGEEIAMLGLEKPNLLRRLLELISNWHLKGMETVMDIRPDIYVQGEWYGTPFLSPSLFDDFYAPVLRKYVDLAHQGGAKFCYLGTANMMPFLGSLKKLGVDVIYAIDPIQGNWDFPKAKADLGRDVALWGGVNAYLQVVDGTEQDVEKATRYAMETLAHDGGFILSPVDDTKVWDESIGTYADWKKVEHNVRHMVKVWKELR